MKGFCLLWLYCSPSLEPTLNSPDGKSRLVLERVICWKLQENTVVGVTVWTLWLLLL